MIIRILYTFIALVCSFSIAIAQNDFFNLKIPNSPDDVDLQVWKPYKSPNAPIDKGHTAEWISKDGYKLAFDATEESHWHVYNSEGKRLQANGKLAGYEKDGVFIYKKGARNAHLFGGDETQIKISKSSWIAKVNQTKTVLPKTKTGKISGTFGIMVIIANLSSIFVDSPQSPIYTFQGIGEGQQYRATIDFATGIIYEWHCETEDCKIRRVDYFSDYEYINSQWRGTGWYDYDLFDENGEKIINY